jgi:hypothetical protein
MVTAIVALKVDRKKVNEIASQLSGMKVLPRFTQWQALRFDCLVRTKDNEALSDLVTGRCSA